MANYDELLGALVGVSSSPVSIYEGLSTGDWDVSCQHLERGGFPSPVDSQQPETLMKTMGRPPLEKKQCSVDTSLIGKHPLGDISNIP